MYDFKKNLAEMAATQKEVELIKLQQKRINRDLKLCLFGFVICVVISCFTITESMRLEKIINNIETSINK